MTRPFKYYVASLPESMREVTYRVHILGETVEYVSKNLCLPKQAVEVIADLGWIRAKEAQQVWEEMEKVKGEVK